MAGIDFDCCNIGSMRYEYSAYCFKPSDKAMFDEALQGQLTMQEEINSLKGIDNGNTENTDNAENSENTADFENSAEENGNQ